MTPGASRGCDGTDIGLVLTDRDAESGIEVDGVPVLQVSARSPEAVVDPVAGDLFGLLIDLRRAGTDRPGSGRGLRHEVGGNLYA